MSGNLQKKDYELDLYHANVLVSLTDQLLVKASERDPGQLPMFRFNNLHNGCSQFPNLITKPRLAYTFYDLYTVHSSPVVHQGRLYFGADSKALFCLDALTGTEIWRFKVQAEIRSTPLIHGQFIYFGCFDHYFYCLNAEKGSLRWRFQTGDWIFLHRQYYLE